MKKILSFMLCLLLVVSLTACGKKKTDEGKDNNQNQNPTTETKKVVDHSAAELKELAKTAGYITNDYLACYTGLTEDQMEGFTVDIQNQKNIVSYCVIVAVNEDYAKQACEALQSEYTNCIRNGRAVVFPEYNAPSDVVKSLTSIVEGRPVTPTPYDFGEDDNDDQTPSDTTNTTNE